MSVLSDLTALAVGKTTDQIMSDIIGGMIADGFPVSAWDATSTPLGLIKGFKIALASAWNLVPTVAKGALLQYADAATGWLALLGQSNYDEAYRYATKTQRTVRLTDAVNIGPVSKSARTSWIQSATGLRYVNVVDISIPLGGYQDVLFEAEVGGTAYNGTSVSWRWSTTIAGVTITEPFGAILNTPGTDDEPSDNYRLRCKNKWYTLGSSMNDAGYIKRALESSALVTRVQVLRATPRANQVTLVIAGAAGLSPPVDATVQTYVQKYAPNTVDVFVNFAVVRTVAIAGRVYGPASEISSAQAAANAALAAWQASVPIGNANWFVSREEIIRKIMIGLSDDPRVDCNLSAPLGDVALGSNEIPILDLTGLVWVAR